MKYSIKPFLLFIFIYSLSAVQSKECDPKDFEKIGKTKEESYAFNPDAFVARFQKNVDTNKETEKLRNESPYYGTFFDKKDVEFVFNKITDWKLTNGLNDLQKNYLAGYLLERSHGLKPLNDNQLREELFKNNIELKNREGKDVSVEALDLAIADAVSTKNNSKIRVYPQSLVGKANNNHIPAPVSLFLGAGGKDIRQLASDSEIINRTNRIEALRKSGDGILLIGDLHILRGEKENKAFVALLQELKANPPKKLIIGGDVVDGIGLDSIAIPLLAKKYQNEKVLPKLIEEELSKLASQLEKGDKLPDIINEPSVVLQKGKNPPEFTPESKAKIRFAIVVTYLKQIKEVLPDTDISFIVGNHDIPRNEFLSRNKAIEQIEFKLANGKKTEIKLPYLLPLERGELKKEALIEALSLANPNLSKEELKNSATKWYSQLREVFLIKGSSIDTLQDHRHYDLAFANWFTQRLRDFKVTTLIIDPTSPVQIGDAILSHEPLFNSRDPKNSPNLARLIAPSDNPIGNVPVYSEFIRRAINFDQHVSASIISTDSADRTFANHLVGAFSASNSNPGQRYSAAVIDPQTNQLSHVSFFDADQYFSNPESLGIVPYRLAPVTRINFLKPTLSKKPQG